MIVLYRDGTLKADKALNQLTGSFRGTESLYLIIPPPLSREGDKGGGIILWRLSLDNADVKKKRAYYGES